MSTAIAPVTPWPETGRSERRDPLIPRDPMITSPAETRPRCTCGHIAGQHETLGCLGGSAYSGPCPCERSRRSLVAQQRRERVA